MKYILAILGSITAFFSFKSNKESNKDNSSADKARNELTKLIFMWDKMRLYIVDCARADEPILFEKIDDKIRYIDTKLRKTQKHLNDV